MTTTSACSILLVEEWETMKAIYGNELEIQKEHSSCTIQVTGGLLLEFVFPANYPDLGPPKINPLGCNLKQDERESLRAELLKLWIPGQPCVFECVEFARGFIDLRNTTKAGHSEQKDRTMVLKVDDHAELTKGLVDAGFICYGSSLFVHSHEPECTVSLGTALDHLVLSVDVPGLSERDVACFVEAELAVGKYKYFGSQLLAWVVDACHLEGLDADPAGCSSHASVDATDIAARCRAKLPSPEVISAMLWPKGLRHMNCSRALQIFTWGDNILTKSALKARGSQWDINAKLLNGRGGGADTHCNALEEPRIIFNVASSLADGRGLMMLLQAVRKIEEEDLTCVSVFCSKGRHRSVSCAVLLHQIYYPNAVLEHLTLT